MMMVGCIVFPILAVIQNFSQPEALFTPLREKNFLLPLLYLSTLSSVGSYTLSSYATTHLPLSRSVVFSNLTTAISVLAGIVFLKEEVTWLSALCFCAILLGVWGAQRFAAKPVESPAA